jgi:Predicted regulatory domain of a methyltransferase
MAVKSLDKEQKQNASDKQKESIAKEACSYDEVPYESLPFRHSHIDRMAVVASLYGMSPAPVANCSVLEIGSAAGGNIIPMAVSYPESKFLGIDLSSRQVDDGKAIVEELGLENIEIRHQNIMDLPVDQKYDYIICHGVYSWVPDFVADKILQICQEQLNPHGIAYISYNVYPGWSFRGAIRNMMLYRTKGEPDPTAKLDKARGLVNFLGNATKQLASADVGPYAIKSYELLLAEEAQFLRSQRPDYLLHEHLSDDNQPIFFWEFIERCDRRGLKYLSESEYSTTRLTNLSKEVQDELPKMSANVLELEQYMDFVRNRTFRQTLLCRKEVELSRETRLGSESKVVLNTPDVKLEAVKNLHVATPAKPNAPVSCASRESSTFVLGGSTFATSNPLIKAAFLYMSEIWPASTPFSELLREARSRVAPSTVQDASAAEQEAQLLCSDLLLAYGINLLQFRFAGDTFTAKVSDRPKASATARYQSKKNVARLTNQLHELSDSDVFSRNVMTLLDGTLDREGLLQELAKLVANGTLVLHKEGRQVGEGDEMMQILDRYLSDALPRIAHASLLVG